MMLPGSAIVTEVTITPLPAAPLHALEIWNNPAKVSARIKKVTGLGLPAMGHAAGDDRLRLIRYEPAVWLVEGDVSALPAALEGDGALTAIGGGIVRIRLSGAGWRRLLMEGGVFDAENQTFAPGSSAATVIDQVNVRLLVTDADTCIAYVLASYAADMIHFWESAAKTLD
jgi:heterotetrameric sarcosine oxidase gamma subunit